MPKRPFKKKPKRRQAGADFWDLEYTAGGHLKLSDEPAEDLLKFCRWLTRQTGRTLLNPLGKVVDFGCGNGRNLLYLADEYGMSGSGFDISTEAIKLARLAGANRPLKYEVRNLAGNFPTLPDNSHTIALDMMTSHFLTESERLGLLKEIHRILKPGGYLLMKTHLGDGDLHTKRLLKDHPTKTPNTYRHPILGVPEYVYFEDNLKAFLEPPFTIEKIHRSHRHIARGGGAGKRRTITVYAKKSEW